jgi:hypothetical protein
MPAAAPLSAPAPAARAARGAAPAPRAPAAAAAAAARLARRRASSSAASTSGDRPRSAEPAAPWSPPPAAKPAAAAATTPPADPFAERNAYSDADPVSRFMLWYFSRTMSAQLGGAPYDGSYDGFVALSREITRGRSAKQQQDVVDGILGSLLPPQAPANFRKWFPLNKRNAEFNAWITTLGFGWLVGPSEVVEVEVEFEGRPQAWRSGVKIEKCRYLENSGCVGMVSGCFGCWGGGVRRLAFESFS